MIYQQHTADATAIPATQIADVEWEEVLSGLLSCSAAAAAADSAAVIAETADAAADAAAIPAADAKAGSGS